MLRLHAGHNTELRKARDIRPVKQLGMLDKAPGSNCFESVESESVRVVTDGMDGRDDPCLGGCSQEWNEFFWRSDEHSAAVLTIFGARVIFCLLYTSDAADDLTRV